MNSAKYKRHAKLILKHPIKVSFIPILIATIASVYMLSLGIMVIGYSAGVKRPIVPNPTNLYPSAENTFPVFNTESDEINEIEEFLQVEQSDEEILKEMDDLLYNLDGNSSSLIANTNNVASDKSYVLGTSSEATPSLAPAKSYPVQRKMYDGSNLINNSVESAKINVVEPAAFLGFTESLRNVVFPILCLSLAVLGVNYLEDKSILTKSRHKKHIVSKKHS